MKKRKGQAEVRRHQSGEPRCSRSVRASTAATQRVAQLPLHRDAQRRPCAAHERARSQENDWHTLYPPLLPRSEHSYCSKVVLPWEGRRT